MPVDVLVEQVAELPRPSGVAGLRAEGPQPHEVPRPDFDPVAVEPVDRLALEHVEPVLHHMGLQEGDRGAGLEGDDGDRHVVAHVAGVDESGGRPAAIRARHGIGGDVALVEDYGVGPVDAVHGLVGLADPAEAQRLLAAVAQRPARGGRKIGVAARAHPVRGAAQFERRGALENEQRGFGLGIRLGTVGSAAGADLKDALREGFGEAAQGPREHPGPAPLPVRKVAGHDVAHRVGGNDGVGVCEDRPAAQKLLLAGMPPMRGVVAWRHVGSPPKRCAECPVQRGACDRPSNAASSLSPMGAGRKARRPAGAALRPPARRRG